MEGAFPPFFISAKGKWPLALILMWYNIYECLSLCKYIICKIICTNIAFHLFFVILAHLKFHSERTV